MYAQWRGIYYVQLEDDILTKPNFVTTMFVFLTFLNFTNLLWNSCYCTVRYPKLNQSTITNILRNFDYCNIRHPNLNKYNNSKYL